ncbi:uncharacterized protein ACMZJ9_004434 [Mantella aurantiaca]
MAMINKTLVTMFRFSGLSDDEEVLPFLFLFFFLVYIVTVVGNVGIITLVYASINLQTPMYYFLSSLSLVDICYSSVITPNMLSHFLSPQKTISLLGCTVQFYFFCSLVCTEAILLSTMSYDRYVAICHPLHYTLIMTKKKCFGLVLYSSSISFFQSVAQTTCLASLSFCGSDLIELFYCDIPPLLKLSCSDTFQCNMVTSSIVSACGIYTLTTIFISYTFIISSILKMTTTKGRQKAFSTCSSHIICVSTFFVAVFFTYLCPHSETYELQDKVASVFFTIITPMLNPFIYSLRNQEVKRVLLRTMQKCFRCWAMDNQNRTQVAIFEFSGLTDDEKLVPFLFIFFFVVYMVTIVGIVGMVVVVCVFSGLHTPMYYFLSSLSLVDVWYSSVITPNMLSHFLSREKTISFLGCALQFYFFCSLVSSETLLLSSMSYDRYVAICHPLHYTLIMTKQKCFILVFYSTFLSFLQSVVQTSCVFSLSFCGSNFIDHFYCDIPPLLKLSCSNTSQCNVVTGVLVAIFGMYMLMTIFLSYTFIFISIFRMKSTNGRQKAFSTCSSHIICVSIFLTTVFFVYLRPHSGAFNQQDKVASVFYTIMTPMLNPLIYSLRNQEVKQTIVQAILKHCSCRYNASPV